MSAPAGSAAPLVAKPGWKERGTALLSEVLVPVGAAGLKSYVATLAAALGGTLLVALIAALIAWPSAWWRGVLALLVAAVVGTLIALVLAPKRALAAGIELAVRKLGMGQKLLTVIFERLMQQGEQGEHGARGSELAKRVERLPLQSAEQKLRAVVDWLVKEPTGQRGVRAWLARKVRRAVLLRVEQITLAQFRQQGQTHGGVDLLMVQQDLGGRMDELVIERFAGGQALLTAGLLGLQLLVSLGVAWLLRSAG